MSVVVQICMLGALGQTDAPAGTESVAVQSVWDFIVKGGPMMVPLGICSLIALAVIIERLISLRQAKVIPAGFVSDLRAALAGGAGRGGTAVALCRKSDTPIARVMAAGLKRFSQPLPVIEKHLQEAGQREIIGFRKYLRLLSVIAAIAPLMGLLGTIFGMIRAFQTVAVSGQALGKTEMMATGIYEAMITTAAGLLVAIPVLVCYHWICAKIDRLVFRLDELTIEFIEEHVDPSEDAAPAPVLLPDKRPEPLAPVAAAGT